MGKNHRHKKQLKSEKAKVKFRLKTEKTKFLPKGQNVTNVNFKIKPIVLLEQLKAKEASEPLSKRKLNVKELLARLNHHNLSVKHEGCEELGQIVSVYGDEVLMQYLSSILQGICQLILDKEKKIRRIAIKVLDIILGKSQIEKIKPFFSIISSYLRCALTNIDSGIQEDSLLMLDTLLKYLGKLIATNSDKILPYMFTLISKMKSDSKPGRTLTVKLGSKYTSVKWRIKVLERLHDILRARLELNQKCSKSKEVITISADNVEFLPIFGEVSAGDDFLRTGSDVSDGHDDTIDKCIDVLMPLMFESLLEEFTIEKFGENFTILSNENASFLSNILKLMCILQKFAVREEISYNKLVNHLNSKEGKKFVTTIINGFPYSKPKLETKTTKSNVDIDCIEENLLICHLYSTLNLKLATTLQLNQAEKVLDYLNVNLVKRNYFKKENTETLVIILRTVLIRNSFGWIKSGIDIEQVLNNTIRFYEQNALDKTEIFNVLCDIAHVSNLNSCSSYRKWLSGLPSLLCKDEISSEDLNILSLITRRGDESFHASLLENLPKILKSLNGKELKKSDALKLVNLFYFVPKFDVENLHLLHKFAKENENFYGKCVKNLIDLRFHDKYEEKELFEKFVVKEN